MNTTQTHTDPTPNPNVVEYATRIQALNDEWKALKIREQEIQEEVQTLYSQFQSTQPMAGFDVGKSKRPYPKRKSVPRTMDSKMLISSGRMVIRGAKLGQDVNQTRKEAIECAQKVAKKYGVELTPAVMAKIEEQITKRYQ